MEGVILLEWGPSGGIQMDRWGWGAGSLLKCSIAEWSETRRALTAQEASLQKQCTLGLVVVVHRRSKLKHVLEVTIIQKRLSSTSTRHRETAS